MYKLIIYLLLSLVSIISIIVLLITIKFYRDKNFEKKFLATYKPSRIENIGKVKNLSILPLIDYYSSNEKLAAESGVSYLIEADNKRILFDVGFNRENLHPSPLLQNMNALNIKISDLDSIFISHLHVDHVGGLKAKKNRTFALSGEELDLGGIKAYTPTEMIHKSANIEVISNSTKISEGIVSLGPIKRAIWGMGLTGEQALAINVEDKGIVLIVGCGHQTIEKVLEQTEQLFDIPIYAIFGGLHFPVTSRDGDFVFNVRKVIGTGTLPWQGIKKSEVNNTIDYLLKKSFAKIGISAHDSCDWTIDTFKEAFKNKYEEILIGRKIIIK
ncbi:MAG: hypothetical protein APF76_16140 [Desulfitibacter sp. BRH_c19]|nr:MAG: hypothetical protein APF76_16140 [Desulfitibacter sp. BRH_c19]